MGEYFRPDNLTDALDFLDSSPAMVAAGCTDLFPATDFQELAGPVLDLRGVPGLRGIRCDDAGWRIGALTTWSDIITADLPPAFDMLRQAAAEVGSVQIQNAATVAGNLCNASPAADGVPPLLALDAGVELTSARGSRMLPLADFLTGARQTALKPGELMTAINVPASSGSGTSAFLKLGARRYLVISIAMVSVRLIRRDDRIGEIALSVGACSAVAQRLPALEATLTGLTAQQARDAITEAEIAAVLDPISDMRASAGYRSRSAGELLRRAVGQLMREAEHAT